MSKNQYAGKYPTFKQDRSCTSLSEFLLRHGVLSLKLESLSKLLEILHDKSQYSKGAYFIPFIQSYLTEHNPEVEFFPKMTLEAAIHTYIKADYHYSSSNLQQIVAQVQLQQLKSEVKFPITVETSLDEILRSHFEAGQQNYEDPQLLQFLQKKITKLLQFIAIDLLKSYVILFYFSYFVEEVAEESKISMEKAIESTRSIDDISTEFFNRLKNKLQYIENPANKLSLVKSSYEDLIHLREKLKGTSLAKHRKLIANVNFEVFSLFSNISTQNIEGFGIVLSKGFPTETSTNIKCEMQFKSLVAAEQMNLLNKYNYKAEIIEELKDKNEEDLSHELEELISEIHNYYAALGTSEENKTIDSLYNEINTVNAKNANLAAGLKESSTELMELHDFHKRKIEKISQIYDQQNGFSAVLNTDFLEQEKRLYLEEMDLRRQLISISIQSDVPNPHPLPRISFPFRLTFLSQLLFCLLFFVLGLLLNRYFFT